MAGLREYISEETLDRVIIDFEERKKMPKEDGTYLTLSRYVLWAINSNKTLTDIIEMSDNILDLKKENPGIPIIKLKDIKVNKAK
jgi:hypothetical protein